MALIYHTQPFQAGFQNRALVSPVWSTIGKWLFSQGEKCVSLMTLAFFSIAIPISFGLPIIVYAAVFV